MEEERGKFEWVRRFVRWLFGSPFEELPHEFGDPVPPELRVFEAEAEEIQRTPRGRVLPEDTRRREQTKPVQPDEYLEFE